MCEIWDPTVSLLLPADEFRRIKFADIGPSRLVWEKEVSSKTLQKAFNIYLYNHWAFRWWFDYSSDAHDHFDLWTN